jgi:hypothetical protein
MPAKLVITRAKHLVTHAVSSFEKYYVLPKGENPPVASPLELLGAKLRSADIARRVIQRILSVGSGVKWHRVTISRLGKAQAKGVVTVKGVREGLLRRRPSK